MTEEIHKIEAYGYEMVEKAVKAQGTSAHVYLPRNWAGHRVLIIRLD